jgi:hypothetical protein
MQVKENDLLGPLPLCNQSETGVCEELSLHEAPKPLTESTPKITTSPLISMQIHT